LIALGDAYRIHPSDELLAALGQLPGTVSVTLLYE
jgi:hypothetical protein